MRFEHSLHIDAPVGDVWALTLDVEAWPRFTPTMTSVERLDDGPIGVGSRARVKQPMQRAAEWTVRAVDPEQRFVWGTRMFGLELVAEHRLAPAGAGCTSTLVLDVVGRGASVFGRLLGGRLRAALRQENEGFKQAAETASV